MGPGICMAIVLSCLPNTLEVFLFNQRVDECLNQRSVPDAALRFNGFAQYALVGVAVCVETIRFGK